MSKINGLLIIYDDLSKDIPKSNDLSSYDPNDSNCINNLGYLYYLNGDENKGLTYFKKSNNTGNKYAAFNLMYHYSTKYLKTNNDKYLDQAFYYAYKHLDFYPILMMLGYLNYFFKDKELGIEELLYCHSKIFHNDTLSDYENKLNIVASKHASMIIGYIYEKKAEQEKIEKQAIYNYKISLYYYQKAARSVNIKNGSSMFKLDGCANSEKKAKDISEYLTCKLAL